MLVAGFTVVSRPSRIEFRPYSAAANQSRLLSASKTAARTIIFMGRLHYRNDVSLRLRGRVPEHIWQNCEDDDAGLTGVCYDIEGIDGLCHLEGDFVLALHDSAKQLLVVLRDPMGQFPLFWSQSGDLLAVSTSIRPLADVLPELTEDLEYAADCLVYPYDTFSELPVQRTAYRGVNRLLPGWMLQANTASGETACRNYWRWRDKIIPIPVDTVEDAGALVRDRLEAAIRVRLSRKGLTASHFSGGFDSTGIALLASRMSREPIQAISLVYEDSSRLAGETAYIEASLACAPAINWRPVPADDLLDYNAFEGVGPLDEPSVANARWNTFAVLSQTAVEAGADTLLTGDGADAIFGVAPRYYVTELLGEGKVREAWHLASRYSYAYGISARGIMMDALRQFVPGHLRHGIGAFLTGRRQSDFESMTEVSVPSWLAKDFVAEYSLRQRVITHQVPLARSGFLTPEALAASAGDWVAWYAGLPFGLEISRPFYDPRLLALAFALPRRLHAEPLPMKPVLAAALRDVLPEKIRARNRKMHFGIFAAGMARRQRDLREIIRTAPLPYEFIDRAALQDALSRATLDIYHTQWGIARLRVALGYLIWQSTRAAWRAQPVPTIPLQQVCHAPSFYQ